MFHVKHIYKLKIIIYQILYKFKINIILVNKSTIKKNNINRSKQNNVSRET